MTTLFEVMLKLARTVGVVREGTATGGTTTSLIDTVNKFTTGEFPGGQLFFRSGNSLGDTRRIIAYDGKTFTFSPATDQVDDNNDPPNKIDAPIVTGTLFSAVDKDFPREMLAQAVNQALAQFYPIVGISEDTSVVAGQEDYELPFRVLRAEISESLVAPNHYIPHLHWTQEINRLHFDFGFVPQTTGLKIRWYYELDFTALTLDSDVINRQVDLNALHWQAVIELCREGLRLYGADEKRGLTNTLNEAFVKAEKARRIPRMQRDPRLSSW